MTNERIISADSHVNPPKDLWTSRAPARLRERAPRGESTAQGDFPLVDPAEGMAELRRVAKLGLRGFHVDPFPDERGGKALWDAAYEPFWALVEETGLPISFHIVGPRNTNVQQTFMNPSPGVKETFIAIAPI